MYKKIVQLINSGDYSGARAQIAIAIRSNSISKLQLKKILEMLSKSSKAAKYISSKTIFDIDNNEDNWNEEYILRLSSAIVSGDMSEEILYHTLKVCKYVRKQKVVSVSWKVAIVAIVLIVVFALIYINCKN